MNHTVSLEIAKKLQEAGWGKECYFLSPKDSEELMHFSRGKTYGPEELYWRPMLNELLEELPVRIENKYGVLYKCHLVLESQEDFLRYYHMYYSDKFGNFLEGLIIDEDNPHDAAALLWIWCKENGYLSDKELSSTPHL